MTRWLRNLSIRHKFVLLVLLLSGFGLLLAGAAFVAHENIMFRRELLAQSTTLADIVGYQCSAALTFEDKGEAEKVLKSLELDPEVTMACVYGKGGLLMAQHAKTRLAQPAAPAAAVTGSGDTRFLHVWRPISYDGEAIGQVYIRADLSPLEQRLQVYATIGAVLLLVILLITWWLATLFQGVLSAPLLSLVHTAKKVAANRDYTLRANKFGDDELGLLVTEFNEMLEQIQSRDRELEHGRAELEKRVEKRTADLKEQIVERERTQNALRKQNEFVHNVLDVVPSIIFVKDTEGRFLLVNRATAELYDLRPEEMIGRTHRDFAMNPNETDAFKRDDEEVLRTGHDKFIPEEPFTNVEGEVRWMQTVKRQLCTASGEKQLLGVATDITIRKQAEAEMRQAMEAAEAANRSKSEFLANMSHEIRTPMNGIIGMANLLLDTKIDGEQRDFARTIATSSEALLTILSDILDISKIEAGKLRFEKIPFNLLDAVESTADLMASRAHEKGLQLSCFVREDVVCGVEGDPTRLRQVLLNLMGNAIKFTEKGEVHVNISRLALKEGAQTLRFEIVDTGIGIARDMQDRLFLAFTQADGSTTRKYGGTGLGLYISKQLIEMMNGELGVTSAPGIGSTFWFTLTLPVSGAREPLKPKFPGCSALIVTEEPAHQKVLSHYLRELGIWSGVVTDPLKAIEELRDNCSRDNGYSIVIIDTHLCGMDGNTLARTIRGETEFADLPLLMVTSLSTDTVEELNKYGSIPCLTKPLKRDALHQMITRLLTRKNFEPEAAEPARPKVLCERSAARILIAEDNIVNQRLAVRILQKLGYSADVVPDGVKAISALTEKSYDLILMDCQMPEMDGYEATRVIRKGNSDVKIVAMTANAMQGDREKCLESGMDDYVSKPIKVEELAATLKRQLEERTAAAAV